MLAELDASDESPDLAMDFLNFLDTFGTPNITGDIGPSGVFGRSLGALGGEFVAEYPPSKSI